MLRAKRYLSSATVQIQPPQIWKTLHSVFPVIIPTTESFFPGVPSCAEGIEAKAPTLRVSTLPNGIVVATEDSHQLASSVHITVNAGTRSLPRHDAAATLFPLYQSFKATRNRSHFLISRSFDKLAIVPVVNVSRDVTQLSFESLNSNVSEGFTLLADSLFPRLSDSDVHGAASQLKEAAKNFPLGKHNLITDAIHGAAFDNGGLGNPSSYSDVEIDSVTPQLLQSYYDQKFVGKNIVVSAIGVDHDSFAHHVQNTLGAIPQGERSDESSPYVGGTSFVSRNDEYADVSIGFSGPSWQHSNIFAAYVLQFILGGGDAFSSGGPGKGMYSLIYRNILSQNGHIEHASCFVHAYNASGLVGLQASAPISEIQNLVRDLVTNLKAQKNVNGTDLSRGKNQAIAALAFNLERRALRSDDLGRQLTSTAKYVPFAETVKAIENITSADIGRFVSELVASPPSVAAVGRSSSLLRAAQDGIRDALKH